MKKVIAIFLVLSFCFCLNVSAASPNTSANLYTLQENVCVGQPFTAEIRITSDIAFNALSLELLYNSDCIEFVSGDNCNKVSNGRVICVIVGDSKEMTVSVNFRAKKAGECSITASDIYISDGKAEYEVISSVYTLEISAAERGDLNGDNQIGTVDLAIMKQVIAGFEVSYNQTQGDLNYDEEVNTADLALLKKWVAGIY